MATLTRREILRLGLNAVGAEVAISDRCSIHGAGAVTLGNHVRIDDFVVITANEPVVLGSYVHVSAFAFLAGTAGIRVGDFSGISIRATVLSTNDDFSGESMTGPLVPTELRRLKRGAVHIGRCAVIGTGSVVLPGVEIGDGVAVGALSLVKESLPAWGVYAGIPARRLGDRKRGIEELAHAVDPRRR